MGAPAILVVDDEEAVRAVVKKFLEHSGYQVLEAGGGEEALHLLWQQRFAIALLLTDIMMPGISGIELAAEAIKVQPELPVLFMSGYCGQYGDSLNGNQCVQKPFNLQELLRQVVRTLQPDRIHDRCTRWP